ALGSSRDRVPAHRPGCFCLWLSSASRRCPLAQRRHCLVFHASVLWNRVCHRGETLSMKNRLRILRAEKNWSQAELAEKVGVSRQAIIAIENGKYDPGLPLAFKLARSFGK